jgi:multidrug efflux pump subunit AcrB
VETGSFLKDAEDVGNVVAGIYNGRPIYLRNIAEIVDGPEEPANYVLMGFGQQRGRFETDPTGCTM